MSEIERLNTRANAAQDWLDRLEKAGVSLREIKRAQADANRAWRELNKLLKKKRG